jgi:hypothetical protein
MLSKHLKRKWQQILSASDDSTAKLATTVSLLSTTMSKIRNPWIHFARQKATVLDLSIFSCGESGILDED